MEDVAEAFMTLKRAGWSIGDAAFVGEPDGRVWVVSGHSGENLIRAEGTTQGEAWRPALEQAREVGMLGRGAGEGLPGIPGRPMHTRTGEQRQPCRKRSNRVRTAWGRSCHGPARNTGGLFRSQGRTAGRWTISVAGDHARHTGNIRGVTPHSRIRRW
jgi:hypothetical protein